MPFPLGNTDLNSISADLNQLKPQPVQVITNGSGQQEIYAIGGSAQHPSEILVDARFGQSQANIYRIKVNWVNGRPEFVLPPRDLTLNQLSSSQDLVIDSPFIAYLNTVQNQVQSLTLLNLANNSNKVFAFTGNITSASLLPVSQQQLDVRFQSSDSVSHTAVLSISSTGQSLSNSPLLMPISPVVNNNTPFIKLVEAVRRYIGPGVVASIENAWYGLKDELTRYSYLLTHPDGTPQAPAGVRPAAQTPLITVNAGVVNVRSGPGTGYSVLTTVSRGEELTVLGKSGRWYKITTPGGKRGWIAGWLTVPASTRTPGGQTGTSASTAPISWQTIGPTVAGRAVLKEAVVHPDPLRPYATAHLVLIDPAYVSLHLVAGTREPKSLTGIHGTGEIPVSPSIRSRVIAAFNAGFKSRDGHGGELADSKLYLPPKTGLGTVAIYRSGKVAIGSWGQEVLPSPQIVSFRQNLPLIIDHGILNPNIQNQKDWGVTVGNSTRVWRSGLGITASGQLIYAAGHPLSARTLALALQSAGCRRAMQLDINNYWVTFNLYHWVTGNGGYLVGTKLTPSMHRSANRYLSPDSRDFFYLTMKKGGSSSRIAG